MLKRLFIIALILFPALSYGAVAVTPPSGGGTGVANANASTLTLNAANSVALFTATTSVTSPLFKPGATGGTIALSTTAGAGPTTACGTAATGVNCGLYTTTWAASGVTMTAIKVSVTDPAANAGSAAGSLLLDLQAGTGGSTSRFSVDKVGNVTASGTVTGAVGNLGSAAAGSNITSFFAATTGIFAVSAPASESAIVAVGYGAVANGTDFSFAKTRGATPATNTIVSGNDVLGQIMAYGANGTTYTSAAKITFEVDGTPGASNDMPGRIKFFVTADGAGTPTLALTLDNTKLATFVGGVAMSTSAMIGSATPLTLTTGALGMAKMTASASAPGAAGAKLETVCGTNAGSAKLVMYAGTSGTAVTVIDNVGTGVTGC